MATLITVGGSSSTGNGTTFGDLIEKVYRRVMGGIRERTVQLTTAVTDVQFTIPVNGSQAASIAPGVILSAELELMYVTAWDASNLTATVTRGYYGSVPSNHDAGVIVYLNPRYSRYDIGVAINDDLRDLSSPSNGLFRVDSTSIPFNPVFQGYDLGDLPNNFIDVLSVNFRIAPPTHNFPAIRNWRVQRQMFSSAGSADSIFPSGQGIQLYEQGWPGLPMYLMYSAPFIPLVNLTDDVTMTPVSNLAAADAPYNYKGVVPLVNGVPVQLANLPSTAIDIPALGAQIKLMESREIKRNFIEAQPDSRKATDVPAGATNASFRALQMERQARIDAEGDRLARQYNVRLRSW